MCLFSLVKGIKNLDSYSSTFLIDYAIVLGNFNTIKNSYARPGRNDLLQTCAFFSSEKGMNPLFRGGAVALAPKPTD